MAGTVKIKALQNFETNHPLPQEAWKAAGGRAIHVRALAGQIVEVPDALAERVIRLGYAEKA